MSELAWRLFRWMCEPSKLKGLAWHFFFWITPRWLSKKFQMYMLRCIVERYPAEVDRSMRESARAMKQQHFPETGWSEEEIVEIYKRGLDLMMDPQALKRAREQARKGDFSQFGLREH